MLAIKRACLFLVSPPFLWSSFANNKLVISLQARPLCGSHRMANATGHCRSTTTHTMFPFFFVCVSSFVSYCWFSGLPRNASVWPALISGLRVSGCLISATTSGRHRCLCAHPRAVVLPDERDPWSDPGQCIPWRRPRVLRARLHKAEPARDADVVVERRVQARRLPGPKPRRRSRPPPVPPLSRRAAWSARARSLATGESNAAGPHGHSAVGVGGLSSL